jgi:hypothetical protein
MGPTFFQDMTEQEFARRFGNTPFERAGLEGMRRNFHAAFGSTSGAADHDE